MIDVRSNNKTWRNNAAVFMLQNWRCYSVLVAELTILQFSSRIIAAWQECEFQQTSIITYFNVNTMHPHAFLRLLPLLCSAADWKWTWLLSKEASPSHADRKVISHHRLYTPIYKIKTLFFNLAAAALTILSRTFSSVNMKSFVLIALLLAIYC